MGFWTTLRLIIKFGTHGENCLQEMLKVWLKQLDPAPRGPVMVEALEVLGEPKLARELKDKYCPR